MSTPKFTDENCITVTIQDMKVMSVTGQDPMPDNLTVGEKLHFDSLEDVNNMTTIRVAGIDAPLPFCPELLVKFCQEGLSIEKSHLNNKDAMEFFNSARKIIALLAGGAYSADDELKACWIGTEMNIAVMNLEKTEENKRFMKNLKDAVMPRCLQ